MWEWEDPGATLERVGGLVDLLFLALERSAASATDICYEQGIDRHRFPHAWCDLVRTLTWTRELDGMVSDGLTYAFSDGNAGIAVQDATTTIRVLHEYEGRLPPAQSDARRNFYRQPEPTLFTITGSPRRVDHLVALWGYEPERGLWLTLVAPRGPDALADPIWAQPIAHPYEQPDADLHAVTAIHDHLDDVAEVQPLDDLVEGSPVDEVDDVQPLEGPSTIDDDDQEEAQ